MGFKTSNYSLAGRLRDNNWTLGSFELNMFTGKGLQAAE